jgi:hypothetical protein
MRHAAAKTDILCRRIELYRRYEREGVDADAGSLPIASVNQLRRSSDCSP